MKCNVCYIGRMQPARLPFLMAIDHHMMVVPNVLAQQCDVCGTVKFNDAFLAKVDILLEQLDEDRRTIHQSDWSGKKEPTPDWQAGGRGGVS